MSLLLLFASAPVGPINGSLTKTEDDDVLAASATLVVNGSLASTEAGDAPSAAGALTITASAFPTEADDSSASTATLLVQGNLATAEGDDVPSAADLLDIVGTLAATEADDSITATAAIEIEADLGATEGDDTLDASAHMQVFIPRRGGIDPHEEFERRQIEWQEQLRRIIDRSFRIANGEIDPITFEPIPPPDYSPVVNELINQALSLDQARAEAFIAEQERLQEDEAIAVLLLAA